MILTLSVKVPEHVVSLIELLQLERKVLILCVHVLELLINENLFIVGLHEFIILILVKGGLTHLLSLDSQLIKGLSLNKDVALHLSQVVDVAQKLHIVLLNPLVGLHVNLLVVL